MLPSMTGDGLPPAGHVLLPPQVLEDVSYASCFLECGEQQQVGVRANPARVSETDKGKVPHQQATGGLTYPTLR